MKEGACDQDERGRKEERRDKGGVRKKEKEEIKRKVKSDSGGKRHGNRKIERNGVKDVVVE